MIFKIRYTKSIAHAYCMLYVARQPNMTWANCGKLTIRLDELEDMKIAMSGIAFEEYDTIGLETP